METRAVNLCHLYFNERRCVSSVSKKVTLALNLRLLYLDERRRYLFTCVSYVSMKGDAYWQCVSPLSREKETLLVYVCLLCLDERRRILAMHASYDPSMS
jgi:hypothetical protein